MQDALLERLTQPLDGVGQADGVIDGAEKAMRRRPVIDVNLRLCDSQGTLVLVSVFARALQVHCGC